MINHQARKFKRFPAKSRRRPKSNRKNGGFFQPKSSARFWLRVSGASSWSETGHLVGVGQGNGQSPLRLNKTAGDGTMQGRFMVVNGNERSALFPVDQTCFRGLQPGLRLLFLCPSPGIQQKKRSPPHVGPGFATGNIQLSGHRTSAIRFFLAGWGTDLAGPGFL